MKKIMGLVLVVAALVGLGPRTASAHHRQQGAKVKDIQVNAQALEKDAAIYQRKRTNSEVDRIVRDVSSLQNALAVHGCLKAEALDLQDACASLRTANLSMDTERSIAAVKRLTALANDLITKDCGSKP